MPGETKAQEKESFDRCCCVGLLGLGTCIVVAPLHFISVCCAWGNSRCQPKRKRMRRTALGTDDDMRKRTSHRHGRSMWRKVTSATKVEGATVVLRTPYPQNNLHIGARLCVRGIRGMPEVERYRLVRIERLSIGSALELESRGGTSPIGSSVVAGRDAAVRQVPDTMLLQCLRSVPLLRRLVTRRQVRRNAPPTTLCAGAQRPKQQDFVLVEVRERNERADDAHTV